MAHTDRVIIENGEAYDDGSNRIDLDRPEFSELKTAMTEKSWQDGSYRLDRASKTLVPDGGGTSR